MPEVLTPIKAIKAKCLDCSCGAAADVIGCGFQCCPLYPFRMGHNPNRAGIKLTDAQREAKRNRAKLLRNHD